LTPARLAHKKKIGERKRLEISRRLYMKNLKKKLGGRAWGYQFGLPCQKKNSQKEPRGKFQGNREKLLSYRKKKSETVDERRRQKKPYT